MKRTRVGSLLAAAVLSLALVACGSDDDGEPPASSGQTTTGASTAAPAATSPGIVGATSTAAATSAATSAAAATAAATSAAAAAATPAGPQVFDVKATEWAFEQKDLTARPGQITVRMNNAGPERPHTYAVKNLAGTADVVRSDRAEVGQTVNVQFTLTEPGTYQVYCALPGHADRGQVGTITVRS